MKTLRKFTLACSLSAAVALSAYGKEEPDEAIPTIYVRDVMPENVQKTPGAAVRLSEENLSALRPFTLHDALDFAAGVRTINDDALGRRAGIGIRGAPPRRSRKTLLLEDGTPINASTYLDSSAHYTPPMERLESIDVLKGTGQIVHGPLNNHGIVNFRNKQPTSQPETTLEIAGGTLDTLKRHVMHRRTLGTVGIVASYTGVDTDGTFDVEKSGFDDFYGAVDWSMSESQDLAVSLTVFRERSRYDESNLTPQEYEVASRAKRGRFGQEFNTFALNYRKADLMHDLKISDRLSMSTKLFMTDVDRPRFTVVPGDSPIAALPDVVPERPFVAGVSGRMESRNRQYRTYGAETRMELADPGSTESGHTLQWGLRVEDHSFDDRRNRADGGVIIGESNRGPLVRHERYAAAAVSAFLQDVIELGSWTMTPGLRAEHFTQSKVRDVLPDDPGPHDPKQKDRNTVLLPGVSVLFSGLSDMQVFGSVQRGYSPAIARTAAGFPLVPEIGVNAQLGFRSTPSERLSVEAAFFYNKLKDTLVQQVFTIDGLNVTLNSGDSSAHGIDLALRLDSGIDPSAQPNHFAELAYNYTDATFDDEPLDGKRLPEIPRHAGSLTLGMEHPSGWYASGTLSHFGSFFNDVVNTVALTLVDEDDLAPLSPTDDFDLREPVVVGRVPSRTLLSATFGYALPDHDVTVWVQGRNLTDKLYITDLENGLRPGAERTVVAGVRLRF